MSNWDILWSSYDVFLSGFYNTLKLFGLSAVLAFLMGSAMVFLLEGSRPRLKVPLRIFIDGMRMLPFLILAYLLYYGLPSAGIRMSAWTAGIIALVIYTAFLVIITVRELTAAASSLSSTYFIPMEAFIVVIGFYWLISIGLELFIKMIGRFGAKRGFENA